MQVLGTTTTDIEGCPMRIAPNQSICVADQKDTTQLEQILCFRSKSVLIIAASKNELTLGGRRCTIQNFSIPDDCPRLLNKIIGLTKRSETSLKNLQAHCFCKSIVGFIHWGHTMETMPSLRLLQNPANRFCGCSSGKKISALEA